MHMVTLRSGGGRASKTTPSGVDTSGMRDLRVPCHVPTCRCVVPASRSSIRRRESWPPKMQGVSRAACMHGSLNGRASCLSMPRFDSRWVDWLIGTTCWHLLCVGGSTYALNQRTRWKEKQLLQVHATCSLNWIKRTPASAESVV